MLERKHNSENMMSHITAFHRRLETLQVGAISYQCDLCNRNHPTSQYGQGNMVNSSSKLIMLILLDKITERITHTLPGWRNILTLDSNRIIWSRYNPNRRHLHKKRDLTWMNYCINSWNIPLLLLKTKKNF